MLEVLVSCCNDLHWILLEMRYGHPNVEYKLDDRQELIQFWTGYMQRWETESCAFWKDYLPLR